MFCNTDRRRNRSGVILLLVLGMILMMAWLTIEVLAAVRKELPRKPDPAQQAQLRSGAYQLLEISIGVLAEIHRVEGGLYSPSQGWGNPLSYSGAGERARAFPRPGESDEPAESGETNGADGPGGEPSTPSLLEELAQGDDGDPFADESGAGRVFAMFEPDFDAAPAVEEMVAIELSAGLEGNVRVLDESGKLPLTETGEERWHFFFEAMGFEETERNLLTDSLLDWMDADDIARPHGAESDIYQLREPPHRAPNRPLRDFRELRLIQGFDALFFEPDGSPNEYYRQFRESVSLFHKGEINLNTANRLVLETLAEELDFEADDVLQFLAGADAIFGTADDRILRPGLNVEDLPRNADGDPIPHDRPISTLHLRIEVTGGQSVFTLEAMIDVSQPHPGGVYPYRIVQLFENTPVY